MTDDYTRDFRKFEEYPFPGKNLPEYYDHLSDAGDGYPGLQHMIHHAISAYGPRHFIEGSGVIDGLDVTGSNGYVMFDGDILEVSETDTTLSSDGDYFIVDQNGDYVNTTDPDGVIVAENINGTVYQTRRRESGNKNYFPKETFFYGDSEFKKSVNVTQDVTGDRGLYVHITGDNITGGSITGTRGLYTHLTGTRGLYDYITGDVSIKGTEITGTKGLYTNLTGTNFISDQVKFSSSLNDNEANGMITTVTISDADSAFSKVLYQNSDGGYYLSDCTDSTEMPASVLALEAGAGTYDVLTYGFVKSTAWGTFTPGESLYASTSGDISSSPPAGAGDQVQIVGQAIASDTILFNPQYTTLELL